ncbi:hypothetical protein BKA70DRAFT_1278062 [Coprinopsis sp. MPI-PUGE-AT-0042]|nr:hypothetical protein BKA70DRAFT_1278062 [Coprinopsis sp. MPI-PUGE-AT-0042]
MNAPVAVEIPPSYKELRSLIATFDPGFEWRAGYAWGGVMAELNKMMEPSSAEETLLGLSVNEAMNAVLEKHPECQRVLAQTSQIPKAARILVSRADGSILLQALALLQLKRAIEIFKTQVLNSQANDMILWEAMRRDKAFAEQVLEVDQEVEQDILASLDTFSPLFDSDFGLLQANGVGTHNILEELQAEGIPYLRSIASH